MKNFYIEEIKRFVIRNWWHAILLIPGALIITTLHESAHALSVIAQGGTITEFNVLSGNGNWGHVRYRFPPGSSFSRFTLAFAPYFFWIASALSVSLFSFSKIKAPYWLKSFIYIRVFVIPIGDIANAYVPWLIYGVKNDFRSALGSPSFSAWLLLPVLLLIVFFWGNWVQQRLFHKEALSTFSYSTLFTSVVLVILLLNF